MMIKRQLYLGLANMEVLVAVVNDCSLWTSGPDVTNPLKSRKIDRNMKRAKSHDEKKCKRKENIF